METRYGAAFYSSEITTWTYDNLNEDQGYNIRYSWALAWGITTWLIWK